MFSILLVPLVILLTLLYYISKGRHEHSPPGPKGKIIVGVLFDIEFDLLYKKLHEWSMTYGDVFQFNLMGKTFVSLNSAEILRDTFIKEPNATITAARPPSNFGRNLLDNYSDLISSSPTKNWTKRRKFTHQLLHAYGKGLQNIEKIIKQNLRLLKEELVVLEGKDQDPSNFIDEFILNTVEILLIGRAFGKDGDFQPLIRRNDELLNILVNPGWDLLYSKFPILRSLSLQKSLEIDEFIKTKKQLLNLLNKYTENVEDDENAGIFFNIKKAVEENKSLKDPWITEENIINVVINMISAGYLTTRGTLISMVQLLAKRHDLQKRLQKEIDGVVGPGRQPNLGDREKCPLTEAVILETLRYISHVPGAVVHKTMEPCTISGYHIEKDTTIIPNLWTIHHNAEDWGDPFIFRPERFLENTGNLLPATSPERKRMLAFGLGKRACIGEVFAKSRIFLFLATLMQTISIHEPESENLADLDPTDMVPATVLQPRPYKVRFVLR